MTLDRYLDKSFYKTASLIAASCRSAAVFSEGEEGVKEAMFAYGKHLGLAFQVRMGRLFGNVQLLQFLCTYALRGVYWFFFVCGAASTICLCLYLTHKKKEKEKNVHRKSLRR